ncbi:MAG TPA: phBC6A51 family helix-turn-helix protein [Candidatus Paceibacterota bacterium]|nr:phBC6A51 family helix-turn-helix protein [Candidatus Paceibacterota bacterium]HMO82570.1 phBC6A51 family helix-turn-helix protein [Candidatus Paceibacterota bacterium]
MKKDSHAPRFLDELRKVPIVQVACEKSGISRNTVYRWLKEDKEFAKEYDEAEAAGIEFVNDMSESQLLQLIKDRKFSAIRLWLTSNHKRFATKPLKRQGEKNTELSDDQKDTIKQALEYANLIKPNHE